MDADNSATHSCQQECIVRNHNVSTAKPISGGEDDEHMRKIFIGGLSVQTTAETLRSFFQQFGTVADAVVMRDPVTSHSRGFGFVTYVEPGSVENVQRARPHNVDNKAVETKRALPRHEFFKPGGSGIIPEIGGLGNGGVVSNKIFLGGLKDCHDEENVREYFSQFGGVTTVKLLMDKDTGRKRGYGFVEFEDPVYAERALAQVKHSIKLNTVEVKRSTQKPDPSKRPHFPISGSVRDRYMAPLPSSMDSFSCSTSYNPYLAQALLPPSAFINGWASYVTSVVKPVNTAHYGTYNPNRHYQPQPPLNIHSGYGPDVFPKPGKYANHEWKPSKVREWPPKAGHKHAQTSTADGPGPTNDCKCIQASTASATLDMGARGDADGGSTVGLGTGSGTTKKSTTEDCQIFKPAQPQLMNPKVENGAASPAYGI
ncbi:ribonucleoprotein RB97D [Drosophila ficusphila]|uniref:ribonucleoprotein RB97D n=1 Tax=Drosophila ficusphila TaxID=30025 RepID=UPI0007E7867C|nr:ribonucleoprotein RB97D [Drosophila ficusphila]